MKPRLRYQPTEEDYDIVKSFALSSAKYHIKRKRTLDEVISDIIVGKLGEISYKSWMGDSVSETDLVAKTEHDPGWDFVKIDGTRVQVKTLRTGVNWVSFSNWNWDEIAVIRYHVNYFELEHIKTKKEVNAITKPSKFRGFYYEAKS
jgi:hypothetical protein